MKNIEALPLNKENFKDLFSLNFLIILVISFPSAIVAEYFKIPLEKLLIAFLQSFASNLINVGIKHIPLGQSEGQKILINFLPVIEKQANIYKIAQVNDLGSSAFLSDLSSMYHETLNNRIYKT